MHDIPLCEDPADRIKRAVADGDIAGFRALVFTPDVLPGLTQTALGVFRDGFYVGTIGSARLYQSFVGVCVTHQQPKMLREVVESAGAGLAPAERVRARRDCFRLLCSAAAGDDPYCKSPAGEIEDRLATAWPNHLQAHRDFIMMTLEFLPEDEALARLRARDAEIQALISQWEMELRIRQTGDLAAPQIGDRRGSPAPTAPRRHRTV